MAFSFPPGHKIPAAGGFKVTLRFYDVSGCSSRGSRLTSSSCSNIGWHKTIRSILVLKEAARTSPADLPWNVKRASCCIFPWVSRAPPGPWLAHLPGCCSFCPQLHRRPINLCTVEAVFVYLYWLLSLVFICLKLHVSWLLLKL